jgi:hypothetical protein
MKNLWSLIALGCMLLVTACSTLFPTPPLPEIVVFPSSTATDIPPTATFTFTPTFTLPPTNTQLFTWTPGLTPTVSFTVPPFPTSTRTPTKTKTPVPRYQSRGDLHMHTTCSDGNNTFDEMVWMALVWHYDYIAITDHHMCYDVQIACNNEDRLVCFYGQEVGSSANKIEILAIGINTAIDYGKQPAEIVDLIHQQGGIAIAAHPWGEADGNQRFTQEQLMNSGLDAMECPADGSHPFDFDTSALPCVYDSDAHHMHSLDPIHSTICDVRIQTLDGLRGAILSGKCHQGTHE